MNRRQAFVVVLAVAGFVQAGCGSRSATPVPVSGTVKLNGKPLPGDATAYISFTPTTPAAVGVSAAITSGSYACAKTPQGPVTVFFEITKPLGPPTKSDRTGQMVQETVSLVPARYATGVPLTVTGPMTHDFDLTE
jgi:hypothetical protein